LRKPDPKAITDLLIFSLAADLDDRVPAGFAQYPVEEKTNEKPESDNDV